MEPKFTALGAAMEVLQARYGGLLDAKQEFITIPPAVSFEVAQNDPERVLLAFVNTGGDIITLNLRAGITPGVGMILASTGNGTIVWNEREHSLLPTLQWFGFAQLGSSCYRITVRRDVQTNKVARDV